MRQKRLAVTLLALGFALSLFLAMRSGHDDLAVVLMRVGAGAIALKALAGLIQAVRKNGEQTKQVEAQNPAQRDKFITGSLWGDTIAWIMIIVVITTAAVRLPDILDWLY